MTTWLPEGFSFSAGLPEAERRHRLLVPLQAYIDESGGKGQTAVLTFAGFIGEAEEWGTFSHRWAATLRNEPSIRFFKMDEAVKLRGQFKGWKASSRDQKIRELARVIDSVSVRFIQQSIDLRAFQKNMAAHWIKPQRNPYFLGFLRTFVAVCVDAMDWGRKKERIEIVFDEHDIFAPRIKLWFPLIYDCIMGDEDLREIVPTEPLFRDDVEFLPLQAADLMAWLVRRAYEDRSGRFDWIVSELKKTKTPICSDFMSTKRMRKVVKQSYEIQKQLTPAQIRKWRKRLGPEEI